ncbi:MAG: 16S rRNA (guanine(527)-N(7))-methyltransferase RsmG, partial [Rhodobacteraceae bacterium]|nr:16S rRNA (guanine(527)-N(7))-methyltransferase RsmG [Paracoccaceae bacterium]
LRHWNGTINLVARGTLAEVWWRHVADSAQLLALAPAPARLWADLGSGAGFPGLVVAILAAESRPDLQVTLVEGDGRKAAFLATALRTGGVAAGLHAARAETVPPLGADVVSARAVAPLRGLLPLARRHLAPGGVALFPKGAAHGRELADALASCPLEVHKHTSRTDPDAVILEMRGLARG